MINIIQEWTIEKVGHGKKRKIKETAGRHTDPLGKSIGEPRKVIVIGY